MGVPQRCESLGGGGRGICYLRMAVVAKELRCALLDHDKLMVVGGNARTDPVASWEPVAAQPSKPSTMTISASAYFCRIAFAAWYSGEL